MRHRGTMLLLLWIFNISAFGMPTVVVENDQQILWQIGEFDDNNSEFSLAPNHFSQYDRPGFHVVGLTNPAENWPYILPGELDKWAGPEAQTFEIIFYLDKVVSQGECHLLLDFMDTHSYAPPSLHVTINDQSQEHQTKSGNNDWLMAAENGSGREYLASFLLPAKLLRKGENCIEISVLKGSWALWDAVSLEVPAGVRAAKPENRTILRSMVQKQLLVRLDEKLIKPLELEIMHSGSPTQAVIRARGAKDVQIDLKPGLQLAELWLPETEKEEEVEIEIFSGGELLVRSSKLVQPVKKWEVHLIHQTHLDIGFTHTQEEVLEMQTSYLHEALDLIEKTESYPVEAQFRWHPEGMWAIDEFLRRVSPEKREQFIRAVHDQSIHLDAFYVHLLSGLATGEELIELMQPAKDFEREHGMPVKTAIGSDIPGYSWGLVTAMAAQGIEFFNMAPNNNHRLGHLYHWADKPFYWLGPDGHSKVLTWMASHAYIYFWDQDESMMRVPRFLDYLEKIDFPYDMAMLRYEIGGDNGHPDPSLPDKVREWNNKYAWPKIIISTNSRLYESFTDRYKNEIPIVSGDLTPYWEDGATSTSADLALNRQAGELLVQARALQAMINPGEENLERISKAWNNVIMYDEHTWGAYCSVSDPFDPFTVSQDKYKQRFAYRADSLSREAAYAASRNVVQRGSGCIDVFNTSSWPRSEIVFLTADQSTAGDRIIDDLGQVVVSQRLIGGELAFRAEEIPAFGVRRYRIKDGEAGQSTGLIVTENELSNEFLKVRIDSRSGAIESIIMKFSGRELVDNTQSLLNDFIYMEGRETGKNIEGIASPVSLSVVDAGPLVGSILIESEAPGCNKLSRLVRLTSGESRVDLVNTVDKLRVLDPEGVYFSFPLNIPGGIARMDIPWGVVRPEIDQLAGANRNYFPVQRWMDISNENHGISWVSRDAPIIAFSPVKIVGKGRGDSQHMAEFGDEGIREWWNESIQPDQGFCSWVMSNHWEVNYKAFQEGEVTFRYSLIPHEGGYSGIETEKRGREICQPLMAVEVQENSPIIVPPFSIQSEQLIATSLKSDDEGKSFIVRLYNPTSSIGEAQITSVNGASVNIQYCDPSGNHTQRAKSRIELSAYGITTLKIGF